MCQSSGELYEYDIWYMPLCVDDLKVIYTVCLHLHRCHIDTINSPDDGHIAVRNM